jgi:hypothetical protein
VRARLRYATAVWTVWRTFGAKGLLLRGVYELRRWRGAFRAAPRYLPGVDSAAFDLFRVDGAKLREVVDHDGAIERGDRVKDGEYHAFRARWLPLPTTAIEWQQLAPQQRPWWELPYSAPDGGDVKLAWEPARFGWVYDLVRAHLLTGHTSYSDSFARTFLGWLEANPPFMGVQWSCGQETSVRAIALLYAEANLTLEPSLGEALRRILAASGERIADAIGYAESQRNNHALSEAAALVMLGLRFRATHPEAAAWRTRGESTFVRVAADLFEPDGWYAQHSFTYLRVALEMAILVERGLRADGTSLPESLRRRIAAAIRLLLLLVDKHGDVPNHGSVDGALPLPVSLTGYRDFRPTLFSACSLFDVPYPVDLAPCLDTLCWNRISVPVPCPARKDGVWSGPSGWAVVRSKGTHVFLRAGRYRTRPSHIDPLHLDVRINECPVIVDAGTYAYVKESVWPFALDGEEVHNGPLVDGVPLAVRGPRFLWWRWPEATISEVNTIGDTIMLRAKVPGVVQRTVQVRPSLVEVEDISLLRDRSLRVRWLLHPSVTADQLTFNVPVTIQSGKNAVPWGWYAVHYGERVPTVYIEGRCEPSMNSPARLVSRIHGHAVDHINARKAASNAHQNT